jgi:hypothetical protein
VCVCVCVGVWAGWLPTREKVKKLLAASAQK